jgi:hypothetical protein
MNSPFPGMDPFIEGCGLWGDFHDRLIIEITNSLCDSAPERYLVRVAEREYVELIETEGRETKQFIPDVVITEPKRPRKGKRGDGVAVADPITEEDEEEEATIMRAFIEEEHRENFVEIYESGPDQRLVTSIELLSPANKRSRSKGRNLYLRKRQSLMLGDVNLIEIDLLRGGERMPMLDKWPSCPYTVLVARAASEGKCRVWPLHLLKRLPIIPVPLIKPDPDLEIDLGPMIAAIYKRSRYSRSIDYRKPLNPPLKSAEAVWLKKQLASRKNA